MLIFSWWSRLEQDYNFKKLKKYVVRIHIKISQNLIISVPVYKYLQRNCLAIFSV